MADYTVNKTDISEAPIDVQEKRVDESSLDVALFGKIRLEYGERLNEDLLNILENFACGEKTSVTPIVPDLDQTSNTQLSNPTIGQFWYNSTRQQIYFWTGTEWVAVPTRESTAANWGQIMHGEQLPRPVSPITGYVFPYSECIWTVAPSVFVGKIGYVACATDAAANVTMQYRLGGTNDIMDGIANYLIIGLKGTATSTGPFPTPPAPSPTPSITPTMTATVTPTLTPTPTMTMSVTATVTPTVTSTVTPTVTLTPTQTPAVTPTMSATPTPTPVPSNTPAPSVTPSPAGTWEWSFAGSWAGQESAPCRPDDLDTGGAMDYLTQYFIDSPCNPAIAGAYIQVNFCDRGSPNSIGWIAYECVIV